VTCHNGVAAVGRMLAVYHTSEYLLSGSSK
jgi:hypothetical protein